MDLAKSMLDHNGIIKEVLKPLFIGIRAAYNGSRPLDHFFSTNVMHDYGTKPEAIYSISLKGDNLGHLTYAQESEESIYSGTFSFALAEDKLNRKKFHSTSLDSWIKECEAMNPRFKIVVDEIIEGDFGEDEKINPYSSDNKQLDEPQKEKVIGGTDFQKTARQLELEARFRAEGKIL